MAKAEPTEQYDNCPVCDKPCKLETFPINSKKACLDCEKFKYNCQIGLTLVGNNRPLVDLIW